MTNIVGGHSNNFSQSGSSKDSLTIGVGNSNTELDFFELISFATQNHDTQDFSEELTFNKQGLIHGEAKGNDSEVLENLIKVASNKLNLEGLSADTLEPKQEGVAFLNGNLQNSLEGEFGTDNNFTTASIVKKLQSFQIDDPIKSRTVLLNELAQELKKHILLQNNILQSQADKNISYLKLTSENRASSSQLSNDTLHFMQVTQATMADRENVKAVGLSKNESSVENAALFSRIKLTSFENLKNGNLNLEIGQLKTDIDLDKNYQKFSQLYLNSDVSSETKNENIGNFSELDITFGIGKIKAVLSDINQGKHIIKKQSLNVSNNFDEFNALNIDLELEGVAALLVNIDPGSMKNVEHYKNQTRIVLNVQEKLSANAVITSDIRFEDNIKISAGLTEPNLNTENSLVKSAEATLLDPSEIDLSTEMLIYLKDKIKQANKNQLQNLIKKDDIQKFLEKNELGFAIEKSVKSIFDKEFGSIKRISEKNKLSMSTADVLSFRIGEKKSRSAEMFDNMVSNKADSLKFDGQLYLKSNPFARDMVSDFDLNSSNEQLNKQTQSQIGSPQIRAEQTNLKTQTFQNVTNGNKFSVLEAQFSSRIASAVLEQAINSKENFDLILEPESFGKVRVNISLESLQLDVKLTAENNATLAILRASEAVLQSITELNGLKLAEYSVELNSGTQNNGGSKEQQDNNGQNQRRASDQLENSDDNLEPLIDEGSHSLNLIA